MAKGAPSPEFAGAFAERSNLLISGMHACLLATVVAPESAAVQALRCWLKACGGLALVQVARQPRRQLTTRRRRS
jgi:hypothetical protein